MYFGTTVILLEVLHCNCGSFLSRVRQGNVLGYLAEGDYFGETSLVNRRKSQYDRNVTAVVDSELAYLSKSDVLELADEFPELKRQIMSFSSLRRSLEEPRRQFNACVLHPHSSRSTLCCIIRQ